ncbi:hypothetical protein N7513_005439 [Penicillium frequentans]|nr:hypothetical protein N7513_005439 [Penicillium glabrum]
MMSYKVLALALLSCTVSAATNKDPATLYSQEKCSGKEIEIKADNTCVLLPVGSRKNINGAKLPEDVVCDFYTDEKCQEPLWIGMEDPGDCSFSELEIQNKTVSVHCYDGSAIYDDL